MANNIRNGRTTFPHKAARRERAADRFSIKKNRCERGDKEYQERKLIEAAALGIQKPLYVWQIKGKHL